MDIENYMEEVVTLYVDERLAEEEGFCGCPRCRLDVIAIALNDLKPKYVVTPKGFGYTRMDELEAQFRADAIFSVSRALEKVRSNPRHDPGRNA